MNLNPAGLALFTSWAKTLPPRPLPRTAIPVPGEYYLDYIARLAQANHLEFLELTGALDDPATFTLHGPRGWRQHEQQRLATAASQPLDRIARLWWPDPTYYINNPEGLRQMLRPACRRCTARRGITGPVACYLPPHQVTCPRHQLWTGPAARTHAGQLDISQLPEISRARRRHHAQLQRHHWRHVSDAITDATDAIRRALNGDAWTPPQQQRLHQLGPGAWQQASTWDRLALPATNPGNPAIEIAIYPDVIWIAAQALRAREHQHRQAS